MKKKKKTIIVLFSGGMSPGANAVVRAVTRTGINQGCIVKYAEGGYDGLINGKIIRLHPNNVNDWNSKRGVKIRTSRSKEFHTLLGQQKAIATLKKENADALIILGGDGSFRGAFDLRKLHDIPIIGIPCTIDKNIAGTDYTIGYDSALNVIVDSIDNARATGESHCRIIIVETRGKGAGFLALEGAIASSAEGAITEKPTAEMVRKILENAKRKSKQSRIILVSEIVGKKEGTAAEQVERLVNKHFPNYETRKITLGLLQSGGEPSAQDRFLGSIFGELAVKTLIERSGENLLHMVALQNGKAVIVPMENRQSTELPESHWETMFNLAKVLY